MSEPDLDPASGSSVALLGTGIMGIGMARNIAKAGLPLRVWNRTRQRAEPLSDVATVVDTPAEAVDGADIVITMLFDGPAVEEVMQSVELAPEALWAQMSTIGLESTAKLAELAGDRYIDAPVLGTRQPAEQGTLLVVASGARAVRSRIAPVFDAVGSRTMWVSEQPGDGTRLKLVLNAWNLALISGTAQSIAFAQDLGLDPELFLAGIAGAASDSAFARAKGAAMIKGDFAPAFTLDGGLKDARLIADAMRSEGTDPSLTIMIGDLLQRAAELGHGAEDMSAIYHAFR
ncbi:MAG: NAD(P)-dependent oxidoreductase [Kibdelosporangium sp.]